MATKVIFDGIQKLVIVDYGVTLLDFTSDVYSDWKLWVQASDNSKWERAIEVVGGDPIPGTGQSLGASYFFVNGWHMRSWEGDHALNVVGNVYTNDGSPVFNHTLGNYNVQINMKTSNLIDKLDNAVVAGLVWDELAANHLLSGSKGKELKDTLKLLKILLASA